MTRDEFERGYCERSGITALEFRKYMVALPCACEAEECEGWAAVSLDPALLLGHLARDLPGGERLIDMEIAELRALPNAG